MIDKLEAERQCTLNECAETRKTVVEAEDLVCKHIAKLDEMHEKLGTYSNSKEHLLKERELSEGLRSTISRMQSDHRQEILKLQHLVEMSKHPATASVAVHDREHEKKLEGKKSVGCRTTSNSHSTTQSLLECCAQTDLPASVCHIRNEDFVWH